MKYLSILLLSSQVLLAAERPVPPPIGENRALTGGQSAVDFFKPRLSDAQCQSELADAEKAETQARADLDRAKSSGAAAGEIDSHENHWRQERKALLKVVEKCGPCVTVPVKKVVIEGVSRKEVWYVAEGACQYVENGRAAESGFDSAWRSLKSVAGYGRKTGGFDPILEFIPIDLATGKPKDVKEIDPTPFPVFLGLKATEFLGTTVAYRQLADIHWEEKLAGDKKTEVMVTIKTIPAPAGFQYPEVTESWESGRAKRVTLYPVSALVAVWYLNAQGHARYYMAGEFGVTLPFATTSGRESAQEALYTLYKRAF